MNDQFCYELKYCRTNYCMFTRKSRIKEIYWYYSIDVLLTVWRIAKVLHCKSDATLLVVLG